ncbi:MAG: pectic acid lyase [Planctomycetales bacterium]|nr:pectic acid lyase [Planctomycetales bacterium]
MLEQIRRAASVAVVWGAFSSAVWTSTDVWAAEELRQASLVAAQRATLFLAEQVSSHGGYVWRYSADLTLREGEGIVDSSTVWVQPPGTPAVGEAFVHLYEATGDRVFIDAARRAAESLCQGQMRSGGWQSMIEFDTERRRKWAYRVDPPRRQAKDQSSLDDDKTQSALRFLMQLDQALLEKDHVVHEMVQYGLDGLLEKGQLANGGFPQVWTDDPDVHDHAVVQANYPETWSRQYAGHQEYWYRYTLNDNLALDVMQALLLADEIYGQQSPGDSRYLSSAKKLADSLLLAQMPDPQPAWAQQYSDQMQPCWARKFEPPAITGGESQGVIETLFLIYRYTGEKKYLEPIPRALAYLRKSQLPNGRLARFYELQSNRPLYVNTAYQLTYEDHDLPTHYSFSVPSRLDGLERTYERLVGTPYEELRAAPSPQLDRPSEAAVRAVIDHLDERGAWLTEANLRYHKKPGPVIDMRATVANLTLLSQYLSDVR